MWGENCEIYWKIGLHKPNMAKGERKSGGRIFNKFVIYRTGAIEGAAQKIGDFRDKNY